MPVHLAEVVQVVQVDHCVRLVGQSPNLGNGSRQRCLSRAWRPCRTSTSTQGTASM